MKYEAEVAACLGISVEELRLAENLTKSEFIKQLEAGQ